MTTTIHPFEAAGLGLAPFRFIGLEAQDLCYGEAILNRAEYERTGIAITTAPGGSCAYCGQYIVVMYRVRSSDGRTFHVGCDCVEKCAKASAGTDSERDMARLQSAVRAAKRARDRELRAGRKARRQAELAASAESRHGELLARLDRAAESHGAFADMATALRAGKAESLSERQLAWLDRVTQ
jgi:hypothetical protein